MAIKLNAEIRNVAGKGAARAVRNNKNIPAVIYGENKTPVAIKLDGHSFEMLIKKPGLRTELFEIDTKEAKENAMLVDIQYHPVSDKVIHVDFKRINSKKPVTVIVPVEVVNNEISKGLKLGGVLNFAVRSVELVGLIDSIPEKIEIDLTNMDIGDSVHGSDLKLPKGVELGLRQEELTFATIGGKMAEETEAKNTASAAEVSKEAVKKAE
ncbi:MAG: 50S ribosomal protein L25/general stress protein Ctc [Alphaproteobacteria bacterium]|nr:50S ribosomal protein L25/general stress protein Ctc [Alphaproteobacteria bacterium]MBN2675243.1 50S ribosomal protein L25/general stress protein Ctc [Alphaproteobacteria bacterium]